MRIPAMKKREDKKKKKEEVKKHKTQSTFLGSISPLHMRHNNVKKIKIKGNLTHYLSYR